MTSRHVSAGNHVTSSRQTQSRHHERKVHWAGRGLRDGVHRLLQEGERDDERREVESREVRQGDSELDE